MNQFYTKQKNTNAKFHHKYSGRILIHILSVLVVMLISLVSVQSVYAQTLPDATQDFTGYSNMNDGTDRWVSPDNFFILNSSRPSRTNADQWGAFLSDSQSEGIEKTDWFDILVNPASDLGGFEIEDIFIGEYDYGVNVARFQNVIVQGFQGETVVAETEPFTSQSDDEETRYPIDYSVFEGFQIDRFRITFTSNSETPPDVFNMVEFTIKNASTEAPEPVSDVCTINSTVSSVEDLANDYMNFSQSFTACDDGKINSIKLLANAEGSMYPESSVTMTFREGDGLSGTILKNVEIPTSVFNEASTMDDFITIDVSEHNILVSNGLQYTFGFEGDASNKVQIYYSDTSPVASIYSGGQLYADGSAHADRDLIFKMEIGPASISAGPPAFTTTPVTEVEYDQAYTYEVAADSDGDLEISISAITLPDWLTLGATLTGTPSKEDVGTHDVILRATNTEGYIDQEFTIEVTDNVPPVVESFAPAHDGTDVERDTELSITFDEEITLGESGVLNLHAGTDDTPFASFDLSVSADKEKFEISEDERTLTFSYGTSFTTGTEITVTLSEGFVEDAHGNQFAGFDFASATWQFTIRDLISQTIEFTEPDGKTWGDGEFQLGSSTSSEGLTVTYTAEDEDVLSIDGNMATILKAGATKVTATQAGNDDVAAADPVEQTVTIAKAELSVSVDEDQTKIYGEDDPDFTFEATGFVNDENEGIISGSLDRVEGESVGTYAINLGDVTAGDNYTINFTPADFEITARMVTLSDFTADDKTYDATTTVTGTGFSDNRMDGDDLEFTYDASFAHADVDEGITVNYTNISISGGEDKDNYTLADNSGTTTANISAKTLTVTAVAGSKIYGQTDPQLTFSTDGFVGDDDEDILSGALSRIPGEDVGTYTIEKGDLSAGDNYTIDYTGADFEITPATLAIEADSDQTKIYGEADPALTFSTTGFVNDDNADVLSGSLSRSDGEDVGTYDILIGDLSAGDNYTLDFTGSEFSITPAPLTVTASDDQSKTYGQSDPDLSFSAEGFVFDDDADVLTGSLSREEGENVNNYAITQGDLDSDNYTITFESADFAITPAALTVIADAGQTKTYGEDDPEFSFTATGFAFDENAEVLNGSLSREEGENAGSYAITAGNLHSENYTITFEPAEFEITPAALTVTVEEHQTKVYGDADPELTYSASGFVLDDDASLLTGELNRGEGENVGDYSIALGSLAAGSNYTINLVSHDFTINPAELTVVANSDQSKVYGEDDPVFAFTATGFKFEDEVSDLSGSLSRAEGEDVGTYAITSGDLASDNYTISFTGSDFSITPATLTVTVNAGLSKVYGDDDPKLTFDATGFAFNEDVSILDGSLIREVGEDIGSYAITQGSLDAGDNYVIEFTGADFTINTQAITIIADADQTKIYGNDDPEFTFTATGFQGGDDETILEGTLGRDAGEAVGTYELTLGTLTAGNNYSINFTGSKFDITPKTLTITANIDQSKEYGENDPELTFESNGFAFNENESILSGELSRSEGEDAGTYAIEKGDLSAGDNYTIDYTGADFEITPAPLTVEADTEQSKVYGEVDPQFTFATSGLKFDEDATVLSGSLERKEGDSVGTYAINQGTLASDNYEISFLSADFFITPAELTVTVDEGQTKIYGEADPVLTYSVNGFVNDDTDDVLTGAMSRDSGENVGQYAAELGSLSAGDNYTIQFESRDFTITPAVLLVNTDQDQTKVYGQADSEFTYTVSGFVWDDDEAILTGALNRNEGENTGTYGIHAGNLSAGENYTINFSGANFEITPKALQVSVDADQGKTYGENDPELAFTATGFAFDDNASVLNGVLERESGETAGSYAISQGSLTSDNYAIEFTGADFEITPAQLTVNVTEGLHKTFGENDPELTFTAEGFAFNEDVSILNGSLSREIGEDIGSYTITQGSLDAGDNYVIDFTGADFTIIAQAITIIADADQSKVYGDADPDFTFTATGFQGGDDESILTGSLDRESGEQTGSYSIALGSLSAGNNYSINYTGSDFEITPKTLQVSVDDGQSKLYGEDDPTLTFTASGFAYNENVSIIDGSLVREEGEQVGSYIISAGDLSAGKNYSIDFSESEFTITPRTLTVIAESGLFKLLGEVDPEFTFTAENFGRNDDESVLTGSLSREVGEQTGVYAITIGDLDAGDNYTIDYTAADFSILMSVPIVVSRSPEHDAERVVVDGDIIVEYDQVVEAGDVTGITLSEKVSGETVPVTVQVTGTEVIISHDGLRHNSEYAVHITSGAIQNVDQIPAAAASWEFKTIKAAPSVTEVTPVDGSNHIALDQELIVAFDQPVTISDKSKISILAGRATVTVADVSLRDGVLVITHNGFSYAQNYSVSIAQGAVVNADEVASTSYSWQFTSIIEAPAVVELIAPAANHINVELQPGLSWKSAARAESYQVQISESANFESIIWENNELTETTVTIDEDLKHNSDYYWRVRAQNVGGIGEWSGVWSFTTIMATPAKIVLGSPDESAGSIAYGDEFIWEVDSNSDTYQIQISESEDFSGSMLIDEKFTENRYNFADVAEAYTEYFWRVRGENISTTGEWSDVRSFVTLANSPELAFPLMNAANISTAPLLRWNTEYVQSEFRVQLSEQKEFNSVTKDTLISGRMITLTGLQANQNYYWRARIEDELTTSDWSEISDFTTRQEPTSQDSEPVEIAITFGRGASGGSGTDSGNGSNNKVEDTDYRLIGLPGMDQVRLDELFDGEYKTQWRAFFDTGKEINFYDEYDPEDERFTFAPGRGFWVLSTEILEAAKELTSVIPDYKDGFDIPVHAGWNIIANPHKRAVSWAEVQEFNEISADLYGYDQQFILADTLKPIHGYYFYNDPDNPLDELSIPYASFDQRGRDNGPNFSKQPETENRVRVTASFGQHTSTQVELLYPDFDDEQSGVRFRSHHPSLENSRYGMILSDDSSERGGLRRDKATYFETGEEYELQMKARVGSSFTLNAELSGLPDQARVLLVNPISMQSFLLADGEAEKVKVSEPNTTYQMYVGDQAYLEEIQQSLLPEEISLMPNYPNPFNPVTNIRYALPEAAHVRIEVYDILGRRVQVLQNGHQQTGWYLVQFDARQLASGVYFYRLQAGNTVLTEKMMLIK